MLLLSISHIFRSVDTRRNIFISNWCYVCCWTCTTMPRLTGHMQPRSNWPTRASSVLSTHPVLLIWPRRTATCSLDWINNWKVDIFRPTRRSLLPRRPSWTDNLLMFFFLRRSNEVRSVLNFVRSVSSKSRVWSLQLLSFVVGLRTYQHLLVYSHFSDVFRLTILAILGENSDTTGRLVVGHVVSVSDAPVFQQSPWGWLLLLGETCRPRDDMHVNQQTCC